jgi:Trypsin-like peptidase domain
VKRLQPGVIRGRAEVQSSGNRVAAITHDASTLGGNSGSPVIDVDTGEVVALHFAGEYLKANYAVPMYELARDPRVAPKLNFDGVVTATSDFDPAWRSINAAVEAERDPPVAAKQVADDRNRHITPQEMFDLEAIVVNQNRPVVFVRGNSYDDFGAPWSNLNAAEVIISQGLGLTIRYRAGDAAIDFKRQIDTPEDDRSAYFAVSGVEMIHPYWDMALLRVDGLLTDNALRLSVRSPEELVGRAIVTIGYLARDDSKTGSTP